MSTARPIPIPRPRPYAAVAGRLLVFLVFGVAAGFAACFVPDTNGWLWCVGAFLPLGPLLAMMLGAWLGWPEIHPSLLEGGVGFGLLALSLPWATAGCWLGIELANAFDASLGTAIYVGFTFAAVFTVVLAYVALGIVTGDWSIQAALELAGAALITLFLMQFFIDWEQYALLPIGMGLMSTVIGWRLLRAGFVAVTPSRVSIGSHKP